MFTNKRAWLVVRPMAKMLDVSFFSDAEIVSPVLHRSALDTMGKRKFRHTSRLAGPGELTEDAVDLLRVGFNFGMR